MSEELTIEQVAALELEAAAAEAGMTVPEYEAAIAEERRLLTEAAIAADLAEVAAEQAENGEPSATVTPRPANIELPPLKIAFVIDGKLVDVLHVDERLGSIFLSNPTILDVTETYNVEFPTPINSTYDPTTGEFTPPTV